jgi:integrase
MNNTASKLSKLENVQIREHIENWFADLNRRNRDFENSNNNTQLAYESELRQYFFLMCDKPKGYELEYLTMDDISITQEDFENYIDKLCNMKDCQNKNKYVNKTINKKNAAIKNFVRFMKKKKVIDIDISYLELMKGEKGRKNSYGVLEPDEVMKMAELCLEERDKKETKRALILFAFKTGLRVAELLSLTWDNFIKKGDEVFVIGIGKGNKPFEIKVPTDIYEGELLLLNKGQSKVFEISARRVCDLMDRLRIKMKIPASRNIVFHSVRKSFGTLIWRMTDLENARRALRHEDISTTQVYLGESDFQTSDIIFYADKIQDDLYKQVSNGQLLEAIDSLPNSTKLILNMKIQEILNNK